MHASQSYQNLNTPQYVKALFYCTEKKTCTNLALATENSYDTMYREFERSVAEHGSVVHNLKKIARESLNNDEITLVIDDTQVNKIYSKMIEGVDIGFDGCTKRGVQGIKMVTSLLTDGRTSIPINCVPFVGKELAQASYKGKDEIAMSIIIDTKASFKIKRLLADAHYAIKKMVHFLNKEKSAF